MEDERMRVKAAIAGDLQAFDALAASYRPACVAEARAILGRQDAAEDVAQDALLTAYRNLPSLREPDRFAAWLGRIVRHRAFRAKSGQREDVPLTDAIILRHAPSVSKHMEESERARCVWAAVEALEPETRVVAVLYYGRDWPVAKIAAFLELTGTTVKWRLHTARTRLSRFLEDWKEIE